MGQREDVFGQLHTVVAGVERAGDTTRCRVDWQQIPPRIGLAVADVVRCSLINLILHFNVILDVGAGGDGGHVASGELLQLLGLKGVGACLSSDGLCPFRPHSPHRDLPQYGGGNAYSSYSINTFGILPEPSPLLTARQISLTQYTFCANHHDSPSSCFLIITHTLLLHCLHEP